MRYELAHRPRETTDATRVVIDAAGSTAAIDTLRAAIPEDHLVLYVRAAPADTLPAY